LKEFVPPPTIRIDNWIFYVKFFKNSAIAVCQWLVDIFSEELSKELGMSCAARIDPL
jgi:hypothetical protein